MKNTKNLISAVSALVLGIQAIAPTASQAAQVDLGLTLGRLTAGGSTILSGKAVRLGTFGSYSDASGLAFFTGKDYDTLFSAFTPFTEVSTPQVLATDNEGQIYQSFDTGTTATNTRLFAWLYDSATVNSSANWVIISGGANATGPNNATYNPMWLAVAPTAGDINVIELATIYSQIYASKAAGNSILASNVFDSEGANIALIPEPSTGVLISFGLASLVAFRRKKQGV